jgi:hypothetical protein
MNAHSETVAYIRRILEQPEMFAVDFDVRQIEVLLHGFEAGLKAAGFFGDRAVFNREFGNFVSERTGLSGSLGWAQALVDEHGEGRESYDAFCKLLGLAIPDALSDGTPTER